MCLAGKNLLLLPEVELPALAAGSLIGGTEHFDHRHDAALVPNRQDLDKHLAHLNGIESEYPGRITRGGDSGHPSPVHNWRLNRRMLHHHDIGVDAAVGLDDIEPLPD